MIQVYIVKLLCLEFQKIYKRLNIVIKERGESFYQRHMELLVDELEKKGMHLLLTVYLNIIFYIKLNFNFNFNLILILNLVRVCKLISNIIIKHIIFTK